MKKWGGEILIYHNFWGLTRLKIPSEIKPPLKRMSTKFVSTAEFLDSTKNAMEPCLSIWSFLQIHEFTKFQMVSRNSNFWIHTFQSLILCWLIFYISKQSATFLLAQKFKIRNSWNLGWAGIDPFKAAFVEPLACSVHGVNLGIIHKRHRHFFWYFLPSPTGAYLGL